MFFDINNFILGQYPRLGIKYQSLTQALNTRHRDLLNLRTPAKTRRRSIVHYAPTVKQRNATKQVRSAAILHVEDNKTISETVRDTLKYEGYRVELCSDGSKALSILQNREPYALLIFDNELPGLSGIELTYRVRQMAHRRRTPIIMLSASDVEKEAWQAGIDAFLKKPEDIGQLTVMVKRLLKKGN